MKSFTRSQINPSLLVAEKRLDALLNKQMIEHRHLISSHHKEMQELRDSLSLSMERFESLFEQNSQDLKEFKVHVNNCISFIVEKINANDILIAEQKNTIESLHKQLNEFNEIYISKISLDKIKIDLDLSIKSNTISHLNAFQEFQRELKFLIQTLQNDLIKLRVDAALMNGDLDKKIDSNFYVSRIDKEGVLTQIRIYEKSMFIIEKKIENIYTLIERINKRGEVCHKQE